MAATLTTTAPPVLDAVSHFAGREHKLLSGGQWVPAASGKTFPVDNPANGELIAHVADGGKEDIDRAVKAAREAFENGPWRRTKPADRTKMIWKLADLLEAHADEFAQLETLDNGKPIRQARNRDIPGAIALFRYMAGWATKIEGAAIPFAEAEIDTYHAYTRLYDQQAAIMPGFKAYQEKTSRRIPVIVLERLG